MKRLFFLYAAVSFLLFSCAQPQPTPTPTAPSGLKRIVQLDLDTNQPIHTWNARTETIHQHVTPPVGISFTDADSGQKVQFDGTYRIESYRNTEPNESTPESTPAKGKKNE